MCGGTWFKSGNESRSMILTAAHCVMNSRNQHFPKLLVSYSQVILLKHLIKLSIF